MHSSNTVQHRATVSRSRREQLNRHRSVILWFTGLSGSGKSTVAHAVEEELHQAGCRPAAGLLSLMVIMSGTDSVPT
jgi:adenylylsulfate kinase